MNAVIKPITEQHHTVWPQLQRAIEAVCNLRGDDAMNRAALLAECEAQPADMQADLLAHFEDQARLYRAALNVPEPVNEAEPVLERPTAAARSWRGARP